MPVPSKPARGSTGPYPTGDAAPAEPKLPVDSPESERRRPAATLPVGVPTRASAAYPPIARPERSSGAAVGGRVGSMDTRTYAEPGRERAEMAEEEMGEIGTPLPKGDGASDSRVSILRTMPLRTSSAW